MPNSHDSKNDVRESENVKLAKKISAQTTAQTQSKESHGKDRRP